MLESAFVDGRNLMVDEKFMLDEKYLLVDPTGKRCMTPRWCTPLEPITITPPQPEKTERKRPTPPKDIFI